MKILCIDVRVFRVAMEKKEYLSYMSHHDLKTHNMKNIVILLVRVVTASELEICVLYPK